MDEKDKEKITANFCFLVENLILSSLLDHLFQHRILTESHVEEITAKVTGSQRIRHFLSILCRRGPKAFPSFIEALKRTGQEHIALQLCSQLSQEGQCKQENVTEDEDGRI